jgi:hypothetical protein
MADLPVVPALPARPEGQTNEPEDQEDQSDPPEDVKREAQAEEQGSEEEKRKQDAHLVETP